MSPLLEVLAVFTRLGLTSFGGPVAHVGYFHDELVTRRKWTDGATFADCFALCQFLPGPGSSQLAMILGMERAGLLGGIAAWAGFTLPSAAALTAFALGLRAWGVAPDSPWLHGLKIVAVAVVALAVWTMAKTLCPDRPRATFAVLGAIAALATRSGLAQLGILGAGALLGLLLLRGDEAKPGAPLRSPVSRRGALLARLVFFSLLIALALAERARPDTTLAVLSRFYRTGSLVFGGGHVVLPLLEREVVAPGWTTQETFLAGYGAAQAVPGPLFTFAAFLGAVITVGPGGPLGALLALLAIYVPAWLLVVGALPAWERLRRSRGAQAALRGANATVVGLLLAALYSPAWTSAIQRPRDFALALGAFLLLAVWKLPPWIVVLATAALGGLVVR